MPYIPDDVLRHFQGLLGPNPNDALGGLLGQGPGMQQAMDTSNDTGGDPMPLMTSAQQPAAPGPNSQYITRPQSAMDRIKEFLMPTPQTGGLLSSEDVNHSRGRGLLDFGLSMLANSHGQGGGNAPSFGQSLQQGVQSGMQGYEQSNQKTMGDRLTGMQMGQQQHVLQARQAIGQFLSQNMTGDQANDFAALRKAYMMSAAVGDHDAMKALSPMLEKDPSFTPHPFQAIPAGGSTVLLDPRTGKQVGSIAHVPNPVDPQVQEERLSRLALLQQQAAQRGDQAAAQQFQQQFSREQSLGKDYAADPDIKSGTKVAQIASQLQALRPKAMALDPFAQKMALEAALRLRNPDANRAPSPADYKMLANSLGLEGKARRLLENWQEGTVLPAEAMAKLFSTADQMHGAARQRYNTARQQYLQRAGRWKVDPELLNDAYANVAAPEAPTATNSNPLMTP